MKRLSDFAVTFNNPSPLDDLSIRALLDHIQYQITNELEELGYADADNDNFTRLCLADDVNQFMQTLEDKDMVTEFKVTCDETNNTARVIDKGQMNVDIMTNNDDAKYNADTEAAIAFMGNEICKEIDAEIIGELIRLNDEIDDANFDRAMDGV